MPSAVVCLACVWMNGTVCAVLSNIPIVFRIHNLIAGCVVSVGVVDRPSKQPRRSPKWTE